MIAIAFPKYSFFVANDLGYTKHYFAGSERVCSKLGGGMALAPLNVTDTVVAPLYTEYPPIGDELMNMLNRFANCSPNELAVVPDLDPELYGITGDMLSRNDFEEQRYFYHPDHLGSSSFITDAEGHGYQHLQYMPFGETFVFQKLSDWSTPYQFSAKEKDEETGFSYFGARYYNSDISVWLSVDPMAGKAPGWSPYNYVWGNPIINIDSDGRWGEEKARRKYEKAVEKYGPDRVGDFKKSENSKQWGYKVYDSFEDKAKDGVQTEKLLTGIEVWDKGFRIESKSTYSKYKKTRNEPLVYGPYSSSRQNIGAKMRSFDSKLNGRHWSKEFSARFEKVAGIILRQSTVFVFPPLKIPNMIYSISSIPCKPIPENASIPKITQLPEL